jgi:hypothetical protein
MRKLTLLLAVMAIAALPATADAAKKSRKKTAAPPPAAQNVNPNEASGRFVRDAVPVLLPSWAIPFYLSQQTEGPHAYWYRQRQLQMQQQQLQQQQARRVKRVKQVRQQ